VALAFCHTVHMTQASYVCNLDMCKHLKSRNCICPTADMLQLLAPSSYLYVLFFFSVCCIDNTSPLTRAHNCRPFSRLSEYQCRLTAHQHRSSTAQWYVGTAKVWSWVQPNGMWVLPRCDHDQCLVWFQDYTVMIVCVICSCHLPHTNA